MSPTPAEMASDLLRTLAAFDSTTPKPTEATIRLWAEQIKTSGFSWEELYQAAMVIGRRDGEPAKKKLAEVFAEARKLRAGNQAFKAIAAPAVNAHALVGAPSAASYATVIDVECPRCGAAAGDYCMLEGSVKNIPHLSRLFRASSR